MKIVAFLQLRNELEKGNLIRCLDNCKKWSDQIVIYDDFSTDGSQEVYLNYTDKDLIIFGKKNEFCREIFHKQQLLTLTLTLNPDWIGWIDGDTVFDNNTTYNIRNMLDPITADGVSYHNLNLWKSNSWVRLDNLFYSLYVVSLWRNNGQLHYTPIEKLHQRQSPNGINSIINLDGNLVHYGFSTRERIIEHYIRYKNLNQEGIDRLIDEQSSFILEKLDKNIYPIDLIPSNYDNEPRPFPETYNEIR